MFGNKETPIKQLATVKAELDEMKNNFATAEALVLKQADEIKQLTAHVANHEAAKADIQANLDKAVEELELAKKEVEAKVAVKVAEVAASQGVPPVETKPSEVKSAQTIWEQYNSLPVDKRFSFWQKNKAALLKASA